MIDDFRMAGFFDGTRDRTRICSLYFDKLSTGCSLN